MASWYEERQKSGNHNRTPQLIAATLGASVLAALGVQTVNRNRAPEQPVVNGPHKQYIARAGDSEWSIGARAYPKLDPRRAQEIIDKQNPNPDHIVQPGQEFEFGMDAKLGHTVNPAAAEAPPSVHEG